MTASHYAPEPHGHGDTWRDQATCADERHAAARDLWFANSNDTEAVRYAQSICARCPVRAACIEDAMRDEGSAGRQTRHGIRGGLTGSQRRRLYEARTLAAKATA